MKEYPRVMLVSENKRSWYQRVVIAKKMDVFITWVIANNIEEAEKQVDTEYWTFAKEI